MTRPEPVEEARPVAASPMGGFSLLEMLLVLALIGILACMANWGIAAGTPGYSWRQTENNTWREVFLPELLDFLCYRVAVLVEVPPEKFCIVICGLVEDQEPHLLNEIAIAHGKAG